MNFKFTARMHENSIKLLMAEFAKKITVFKNNAIRDLRHFRAGSKHSNF
ncbi:hypothetical protein LEP1GSC082_1620 [Leptospira kirschneri str. H2]|nr:hypothetical protein LEP1GSC082_1620 [Leptospira kirschneri str. H2]